MGDRDRYFRFKSLIKSHTVTQETATILSDLEEWYNDNPLVTDVNWDDFATWFKIVKHPMYKKDKQELYAKMFNNIKSTTFDPTLVDKIISTFIERDYATQIFDISGRIAEGNDSFSMNDIEDVFFKFEKETNRINELEANVCTDDMVSIVKDLDRSKGLKWRLDWLNDMVGGIIKGDFILFSARPEAGKTTLLASESTFMQTQIPKDKYILWFNNEEESKKVKLRILQAGIGWKTEDILKNITQAVAEYENQVGSLSQIKVIGGSITTKQVEKYISKYPPGLIIIDQLRKIQGFDRKNTNDLDNLRRLYVWGRELSKEHSPVMTVHQARGDAEGIPYLQMNQLEGCQTEIQGELDVQIMIGRKLESGCENNRFFNIVKNKPTGRHGKYETLIQPEIGRYKNV